jgi:hypothetical protein
MKPGWVTNDSAGIREILNGPEVRAQLVAIGERAAQNARAAAPVVTGAFRDGIRVNTRPSRDGARTIVEVGSTVPYARRVEAAHGVMARAMSGVST